MHICANTGLNRKSVLPLHVRLASPRVVCRKCDRRGKTSDVAEITELCRLYEKWGYINNASKICMGRPYWHADYKYQQDETIDFNNGFCITYMYIVLNFANTSYWTLTYSLFLNKSDS